MTSKVIFGLTAPADAGALAELTFPAYRHLLTLDPQPRHRQKVHGTLPPVQPVAIAGAVQGVPLGLVLAEVPVDGEGAPELLSLFVKREARLQGVGTRLMGELAEEIAGRGFQSMRAIYMTGKPDIVGLEKIFWKQGWSPPDTRMTVLRLTQDDLDKLSWMHWTRMPKNYETVLWKDLRPEDMEDLKRSDAKEGWIPADLRPWEHDRIGFEPVTSMALKIDGRVVGWVVNHALSETMVRYTSSYIHPEHWRRCALLRLWRASFLRMPEAGFEVATLTSHARHPQMVAFIRKHVAPVVSWVAETRGTRRTLGGDNTDATGGDRVSGSVE